MNDLFRTATQKTQPVVAPAAAQKKDIVPFLIALLFLAGVSIVLYPLISNTLYEKNQSLVLAQYETAMDAIPAEQQDAAWQAAQAYNSSLLEGEAFLTDPFDPEKVLDPAAKPYADLLNLEDDGLMGYVEIPRIDVYLPIYHGTTADVLEKGIGHLQNTSLPVGGAGTHAVLTGHTGLAGKRLFTDLSQLETEDVFYLHILGRTLAYQVKAIYIVEPDQTEYLVIQPDQDLVTLLTCYPYGINTQRLLVQGSRVSYEQAIQQQAIQADTTPAQTSTWTLEYRKALILCLILYIPLSLLLIRLLLRKRGNHTR